MENNKFALLIDSDNISAKYISAVLDEMTKYGVTTYRRIYGDWTSPQATKWKEELLKYSISPIQQFSNTSGKNATDIALIIDAMDILYTGKVDGFCIVSSDGDFTKLASRLRESNMEVIGMGEKKTPRSFVAACTKFTWLENLSNQDEENDSEEKAEEKVEAFKIVKEKKDVNKTNKLKVENKIKKQIDLSDKIETEESEANITDKIEIEDAIANIILENENKNRLTGLGEVGSRLVNKYPDFDARNYGYSLLSKFLESFESLSLVKEGTTIAVVLNDSKVAEEKIRAFLKDTIEGAGMVGIGVNDLSNRVHNKYAGFKVKDYGYSQFSKFIQSMEGVVLFDGVKNTKHVKIVKQ
ncbi:MAG TPA: NYN domain-containing protein [Lachnospiraceae bacterium]|nr:NYN domain-containing protein [Lachnospiraceae bacterium]